MNIDALRAEVRVLDYVPGTAVEAAMWREDDENARANLAIEGMALDTGDAALFVLLRDEAVPPPLATAIFLGCSAIPTWTRRSPSRRWLPG